MQRRKIIAGSAAAAAHMALGSRLITFGAPVARATGLAAGGVSISALTGFVAVGSSLLVMPREARSEPLMLGAFFLGVLFARALGRNSAGTNAMANRENWEENSSDPSLDMHGQTMHPESLRLPSRFVEVGNRGIMADVRDGQARLTANSNKELPNWARDVNGIEAHALETAIQKGHIDRSAMVPMTPRMPSKEVVLATEGEHNKLAEALKDMGIKSDSPLAPYFRLYSDPTRSSFARAIGFSGSEQSLMVITPVGPAPRGK